MKKYWVLGLLASVTGALFANSWDNPLILDDIVKISNNKDIRNIERLGSVLVYPYGPAPMRERNDPSRPLVYLIYTVAHHIWGVQPAPYHKVNAFFHFCNGVLVYFLMTILLRNIYSSKVEAELMAVLLALFFILLPIQAGTVIYAYGLSDVLSSFFILLAFYFYVREHVEGGASKALLNSCLVVLCAIFALASKQTGIVLPFVLGLYELKALRWEASRSEGPGLRAAKIFLRIVRKLVPVIAVVFLYLVFRYYYLGGVGDLEGFQQVQEGLRYLSVQGLVILTYLQLTFIPIGLTIDHGIMPEFYSGAFLCFCWLSLVAGGFVGLWFLGASSLIKRNVGFGILFYLALVLPTSLLPTVDSLVERRVYLANFGLLTAVAGGMASLSERRFWSRAGNWKAIVVGCFLLIYFAVSFKRNEVFASERHIWEESLSVYPGYSRALINSAWIFVKENELERGEERLKLVLRFMPRNTEILAKLGTIYNLDNNSKKDPYIALSYFQQAIEINPHYFVGRYLAAAVLVKLYRLAEAKEMLQKALESNQSYSPAYLLLGQIAEIEKDPALADSYYRTARQIDPAGNPF